MTQITGLAQEQILAEDMSEEQLQNLIIQMALALGWRVHTERKAINRRGKWSTPIQGTAGFPDLVLIKDQIIYVWELKSEKGKLTKEQEEWLRCFAKAGVRIGVIRPHSWYDGSVEKDLRESW